MKKTIQDEIRNPRKSRTNKELFKISKFFYREIFLDGMLASEGKKSEQHLQLIRRFGNKINKNAATGFKGFTGILILFANFPILFTLGTLYNNFQNIDNATMFNQLLFSFTVTVNISFIFLSISVIYFGVKCLVGIFHRGSSYNLLETLPLNLKEKKKIILFAFYRTINAQIIVMFLGLPFF